ncbi:MAG: TspO/MBR family protein [Alphaproteobacteria bacterium]
MSAYLKKHWTSILKWVSFFQIISFSIGYFTKGGDLPWYQLLVKPQLTPPPILFPIIWGFFYTVLGYFAFLIMEQRVKHSVKALFWFHMVANWVWSFLFFKLNLTFLAFLDIVFLIGSLGGFIFYVQKMSRLAPLLYFYLAWLVFAAYLSFEIWRLN